MLGTAPWYSCNVNCIFTACYYMFRGFLPRVRHRTCSNLGCRWSGVYLQDDTCMWLDVGHNGGQNAACLTLLQNQKCAILQLRATIDIFLKQ